MAAYIPWLVPNTCGFSLFGKYSLQIVIFMSLWIKLCISALVQGGVSPKVASLSGLPHRPFEFMHSLIPRLLCSRTWIKLPLVIELHTFKSTVRLIIFIFEIWIIWTTRSSWGEPEWVAKCIWNVHTDMHEIFVQPDYYGYTGHGLSFIVKP